VAGRAAQVGGAVQLCHCRCASYPRREVQLGSGGSSAALCYLRHLGQLPRAWTPSSIQR
jgi:hypothetical protein